MSSRLEMNSREGSQLEQMKIKQRMSTRTDKSVGWARSAISRNSESLRSERSAHRRGLMEPRFGVVKPLSVSSTLGVVPFRLCELHTRGSKRNNMSGTAGRRLRLTFDLTGDSIQSVMALEITKEAQIAGETEAGCSALAQLGDAAAAGQQASAASDGSRSLMLDDFERRR